MEQLPEQFLPPRLSPARLAPYMAATSSTRAALDLYRWNILASGAVYESLHLVEVVLRNAIHDQLSAWHAERGYPGSWLDDPRKMLEARATEDIAKARWRASRNAKAPTEGHVIAELSFGFWRFLLVRRYTDSLWRLAVRHAFPHLQPQSRQRVERPVKRLHELRNRVAHLEPIHARDLLADRRAMLDVLGYVCPDTREWHAGLCRIPAVAAERPRH